MKVIVWKHGDAWAVRSKDWLQRQYGFATWQEAKAFGEAW